MTDTSPTPVDSFNQTLDLVTDSLRDYMATLPGQNWSAEDAPDLALHVVNELRSRASIGPDSERIREADDSTDHLFEDPQPRAAGLLPGPGDVVVSREDLRHALGSGPTATFGEGLRKLQARERLAAALSQPHPAQEQQT